jgi:hypothetical protein
LEKEQKKLGASGFGTTMKSGMNSTGMDNTKMMASTEVNFFKPTILNSNQRQATPPKMENDIE